VNCSTESKREDKFLDKVYNDSITKALENYRKPENLTGDNKYDCAVCSSKQDATKGLKLKHLPSHAAQALRPIRPSSASS
jgi:ubiquitin C-terminal hydrolase